MRLITHLRRKRRSGARRRKRRACCWEMFSYCVFKSCENVKYMRRIYRVIKHHVKSQEDRTCWKSTEILDGGGGGSHMTSNEATPQELHRSASYLLGSDRDEKSFFFFLLLESSAVFDGFLFFLLILILYNRDANTRETGITSNDSKFIAVHALNHSGSASSYAGPLLTTHAGFFSLTEAKWGWEAESCQERTLVKPAASQIPGRRNPRIFLQRQLCCCLVCFISVFVSSSSSIIFCIF